MVPPYLTTALLRNSLTAAACAAVLSFGVMDANPSLFWYHQLLQLKPFQRAYQRHFSGKTVWIVGASSGIGEELAYQLSPVCQKLILSSRNPKTLQQVAEKCRQQQQEHSSAEVTVVPLDVATTPRELEQIIVQKIIPELSSGSSDDSTPKQSTLDCVIFNAGQGQLGPAYETDGATTERMFQVNTLPPIILTQLLMKHKVLRPREGKPKQQLVITSSVGGRMGVPLSSSYAASKHALHGYASSLQAECSSWLRIDMLCPGPIDTNFFSNQDAGATANTASPAPMKKSPLKMPVQRCVGLMMSHMVQGSHTSNGGEAWIAQQPTLLGMYLQQFAPGLWQFVLNKVGPKRISLYEQGLDLYDPASWRTSKNKRTPPKKDH